VAAARAAQPGWARAGWDARRAALEALADAIAARAEEFARLLTLEQGKPLDDRAANWPARWPVCWFAAQHLAPRTLKSTPAEAITEIRKPLGVVAAITPWNFPLILLIVKLAPALITGNTVIAKPAPPHPLTTLLLGEVAAGVLPPGVLQVLVDANDLGPLLARHPGIAHVSFTGSTATGKKVLAGTADTLKRFTLELGGNDAAIVLDDADVAKVAPTLFRAAMLNAGQVCLATKRIYAPRALYGALCDALADLARAARWATGWNRAPPSARCRMPRNSAGAGLSGRGARMAAFWRAARAGAAGYFIPTIVADLPDTARLVQEEQFGPVLPVLAYDDLDERWPRQRHPYGLGGTVWSADAERGAQWPRASTAARYGSTAILICRSMCRWAGQAIGDRAPAGIEGLEDFTQPQIVNVAL
jgi:acyl-CoA reductase-like NAD-dependent aldehyde dehydrogenase